MIKRLAFFIAAVENARAAFVAGIDGIGKPRLVPLIDKRMIERPVKLVIGR